MDKISVLFKRETLLWDLAFLFAHDLDDTVAIGRIHAWIPKDETESLFEDHQDSQTRGTRGKIL